MAGPNEWDYRDVMVNSAPYISVQFDDHRKWNGPVCIDIVLDGSISLGDLRRLLEECDRMVAAWEKHHLPERVEVE